MPDPVRVFVSHHHSPEENEFTERLVNDLTRAGANVWVDLHGITFGNFVQKINEGLAGRQWVILVMTPASVQSPWVQQEINTSLAEVNAKRMLGVIPFVMAPTADKDIPILWRTLQRYDATQNYVVARDRLLQTLKLVVDTSPETFSKPDIPVVSPREIPPNTDVAPSLGTPEYKSALLLTILSVCLTALGFIPADFIFVRNSTPATHTDLGGLVLHNAIWVSAAALASLSITGFFITVVRKILLHNNSLVALRTAFVLSIACGGGIIGGFVGSEGTASQVWDALLIGAFIGACVAAAITPLIVRTSDPPDYGF